MNENKYHFEVIALIRRSVVFVFVFVFRLSRYTTANLNDFTVSFWHSLSRKRASLVKNLVLLRASLLSFKHKYTEGFSFLLLLFRLANSISLLEMGAIAKDSYQKENKLPLVMHNTIFTSILIKLIAIYFQKLSRDISIYFYYQFLIITC